MITHLTIIAVSDVKICVLQSLESSFFLLVPCLSTENVFTKGPSPGFSATFFQTLAAFPYCLDLQRAAEH